VLKLLLLMIMIMAVDGWVSHALLTISAMHFAWPIAIMLHSLYNSQNYEAHDGLRKLQKDKEN